MSSAATSGYCWPLATFELFTYFCGGGPPSYGLSSSSKSADETTRRESTTSQHMAGQKRTRATDSANEIAYWPSNKPTSMTRKRETGKRRRRWTLKLVRCSSDSERKMSVPLVRTRSQADMVSGSVRSKSGRASATILRFGRKESPVWARFMFQRACIC